MTAAADGLGWPGQPDQERAAPAGTGDGFPVPESPASGPGFAPPGPELITRGTGRPGAVTGEGPDGLGWPAPGSSRAQEDAPAAPEAPAPAPAPAGPGPVSRGTRSHRADDTAAAIREAALGTAEGTRAMGRHHAPAPSAARARRAGPPAQPAAGTGGSGVRMGEDDKEAIMPVVTDTGFDTPIARAARAALAARAGGAPWPRPKACRIITIANQKGGVGKTTTAVNLAASLALHGARVLVIDLDPQGNASTALDVDHHSGVVSVYNMLVEDQPLAGVIKPAAGIPNLFCAPATIDLAGAEIELVPLVARESRLARALSGFDSSGLDYIFIDCPPSLGLLTVNALVAAPEVLIPIQCEYYALEGLEQLLRTVDLVRSHLNPGLTVSTILLTMFDGRTRLATQVAEEVREHFGEVVLGAIIPRSVRVSEAPSYGQSVMTYDPGSSGAQAYLEAAKEMARRSSPRT
jgi:chromosome partitioning protein